MLQSELAVKITFDDTKDRPRLQDAINVLGEVRDALVKSGCDCNMARGYLLGAMEVLKTILDGKTIY